MRYINGEKERKRKRTGEREIRSTYLGFKSTIKCVLKRKVIRRILKLLTISQLVLYNYSGNLFQNSAYTTSKA